MHNLRKRAAFAVAVAALTTSTVVTPTVAFAQAAEASRAERPWWVGSCSKLQWILMPVMCATIEVIYY